MMKATRPPSGVQAISPACSAGAGQRLHHLRRASCPGPDPERLAAALRRSAPRARRRRRPAAGDTTVSTVAAGAEEPAAGERRRSRRRTTTMSAAIAAPPRLGARRAGRQIPFSGHCVSPCRRPKPQAFIIPTWQIEKSKRTGSTGSIGAQRRGDLGRHAPARRRVARQAQAPAEPDHVRVERHDQLAPAASTSTRRGPPRRGGPSSAGTGSAACSRCPPTGAERSSRRRSRAGTRRP